MDDRLDHDVAESDDPTGVDRRKFIQRAGIGAAAAGGAWVAPSILGSSVAFAQGSEGGGPTIPPTTASTTTTTDPANLLCGTIVWSTTSTDANAVGSYQTLPLVATGGTGVALTAINGSGARPAVPVVAGPNPPRFVNPPGGGTPNAVMRNLRPAIRPFSGDGTLPGEGGANGFMLAQNNVGGGNTSLASIVNYQEVTFTLSTAVYNLRFTIRDLTATTVDPTSTNATSSPYYGQHRDAIGFNVPVSVVGGVLTNLGGTGTYTDPFHRTATTTLPGPHNIQVAIPGPVTSFTLRYATVGGRGTQFVQLSNFEFGNC